VTRLMEFSFVFIPGEAAVTALLALFVTVGLGLIGTVSALGRKPAEVLRNL
jgi:putative ABC transport system permease protein